MTVTFGGGSNAAGMVSMKLFRKSLCYNNIYYIHIYIYDLRKLKKNTSAKIDPTEQGFYI
jgi:hypothetical protein